ncbi:tripartite motif-containing protein 16-like isoform X2 [Labeo rohita]|uniref:tripartite motif-containing protein 16-like isoform X2 n=1 Tax=Labeo rohita TaxID=84645 RepID=UPI0021E212A0|nr:tripartite motif-containing protein 16-like isoform X2 [Labeo rohita]
MARFSQDQFSCPVCLDLLKDPVTIPCGHSYCMSCITDHWNQEEEKRVYSCPECRQTFSPRPALGKNTMLAEVVEKLKKTALQTAVPAGPEDVQCDVCTGQKHKAVKSCLVCLNSFCQNHLEQHENLFNVKRHNLMDATGRLQEMICHQHDKPLEIYCRTDQQCICLLCMVDEHKNHSTVSAAAERTEKQKLLSETQQNFQQQIKERQKYFQELEEAVETHKHSAQIAVDDNERIFTELISSIERRHSEVTQMIKDREKTVVGRAKGLMEQLKQEIDDLRNRNSELEQLSDTNDHIHFLQSFPSLPVPPGSPDVPSISDGSLDVVGKSVFQLKKKLEDFFRQEIEKLAVRCIQIIPTPEYESRKDFLNYFHRFTLHPNTAHQHLYLSERNRMVTCTTTLQWYPDHPDRFDRYLQVLCRECVHGRCYWEVEWTGNDLVYVSISVSYKTIYRKGTDNKCRFGYNDQSWSLVCSPSSFSFWHNNKETKLPVPSSSNRIGVYVDLSAGILSFYSICDTMTLIHRVQTTFTQYLYPGFRFFQNFTEPLIGVKCNKYVSLAEGSTVKLCDIQYKSILQ